MFAKVFPKWLTVGIPTAVALCIISTTLVIAHAEEVPAPGAKGKAAAGKDAATGKTKAPAQRLGFDLERFERYPKPRVVERTTLTRRKTIALLYEVLGHDLKTKWGEEKVAKPTDAQLVEAIRMWNEMDGGSLFRRVVPKHGRRIVVIRTPRKVTP